MAWPTTWAEASLYNMELLLYLEDSSLQNYMKILSL